MHSPLRLPVVLLLASSPLGAQLLGPAPAAPATQASDGIRFGAALADAGDVDGDGLRDLLVGVEEDRTLRVFSGRDRTPLLSIVLPLGASDSFVVSGAGDVDDDGRADLLVGASQQAGGAGRVLVYSGRTAAALHVIDGTGASGLGTSVAGVGDVDGDGCDDFAAGAPGTVVLGSAFGQATVYSGATGAVLYNRFGPGVDSEFGAAVASAGDVDGDGIGDILVGAPGFSSDAGRLEVLSPSLATLLRFHVGSGDDRLGSAVCGVGDLNGDGRADYAAGIPGRDSFTGLGIPKPNAGVVQAWSGLTGAPLVQLGEGFESYQRWGLALAPGGDVNGDGVADVLVAGSTAASACSGASGALLLTGPLTFAGQPSLARMADQNGDGRDECAIGSPLSNSSGALAGSVSIYRAAPQVLVATLTPDCEERWGAAVALVPDVDGDGRDDVLAGAPYRDGAGVDAGLVRLCSGASGAVSFEQAGSQGDQLGGALAVLGDLTGDGVAELLVGEPFRMGIVRAGAAQVRNGVDGSLVRTHLGQAAGERCGAGLACLGDVNADGVDDYALASPDAASSLGVVGVGRVRAFSGADGGFLWSAVPTSTTRAVRYGAALARIGDVDGDGRAELLVGAPRNGGIDLLSGASGARLFHVAPPGGSVGLEALFGAAVAGPGDVNRDGVPDLLVGAPGYDGEKGALFLLSGIDGSQLRLIATLALDELGTAVAGPGDVDNDGVPDLAAGAPNALRPAPLGVTGAVRIYSGTSGALIRTWFGATFGERFGSSLAGGGDADGDGLPDLVAGAPFATPDPQHEGHGSSSVLLPRILGSSHFGAGTPGCVGTHLLTLGQPAQVGGTLEVRVGGLTPQAIPVLLVTDGGFDPGIPILGGVLLHVDLTQLYYGEVQAQVPPGSDHLAVSLPIPNDPSWSGLAIDAQFVLLWPGGCAALAVPYSSSNGLEVVIQ